jgi:hypothetical protein
MDIPWMKKYKGEKHSKWKGGRLKARGYILIYSPSHPHRNKVGKGYVFEHRLVMEEKLGRFLSKNVIVHHINGIRNDNRIENLVLTTNSKHISSHNSERIWKDSTKEKRKEIAKKIKRNTNGKFTK